MKTKYTVEKLDNLLTDVIDCPHSTPRWSVSGKRVVRNFNLKDGNLDFSDGYFVDEGTYLARIRRGRPEANDIIISREAPIGTVGIVPPGLECCLGQRLVLLKVDKEKCSPHYLLFALMSEYAQTQFRRANATGSIASNLTIPDLKEVTVPIVDDQEEAGELLWSINEAIQLNRQINDNLQAMLATLYDYWFVQFDFPDENGKPYRSSGGKMVWNERLKREIPDGWKVASIIDNPFAAVIKPGVSRFEIKTYLATADVNGTSMGSGTPVQYETRETRANMEPSLHSVWFAKMKASVKHLFFSESTKPVVDSSILSTGFLGLQCNEISFEYISSFVSSPFFEVMKDQLAHGATQEAVNNDNLRFIPLLVPDERVVAAFHKKACESYWVMGGNVIENKTLTGLRDWLLPMLMNGQATVRQPQANYRLSDC